MESSTRSARSSRKRKQEASKEISGNGSLSTKGPTVGQPKKRARRSQAGMRPRYPVGPPDPLPGENVIINDERLLKDLRISWAEEDVKEYRESIPVYTVPELKDDKIYPPEDMWILEKEHPVHDIRGAIEKGRGLKNKKKAVRPPLPVHVLDMKKIERTINEDESCILVDEHGKLFGCVLRNFVQVPEVVGQMDTAVAEHIRMSDNIRPDSLGAMARYGYGCGSIFDVEFCWSRNVKATSMSARKLSLQNHRMMSSHTILWNILKKTVPPIVIQDFKNGMKGLPPADWGMLGNPVEGPVSFHISGRDHELWGLELGPPSGVCASMYERGVHNEHEAEECPWVVSWVSKHTVDRNCGGSFIFAKHGVLVRPAANTMFIHNGLLHHGTTCHDVERIDARTSKAKRSTTVHRGMGFVIPAKLRSTFDKTKAKEAKKTTDNRKD